MFLKSQWLGSKTTLKKNGKKTELLGTLLVVQWFRLCALTAGAQV